VPLARARDGAPQEVWIPCFARGAQKADFGRSQGGNLFPLFNDSLCRGPRSIVLLSKSQMR